MDDKTVGYIGGIIRRVDNFNMNSFDRRLIFQKTVYLIQAFGIYLGFDDFSWYRHGPYSSNLAKVGFALMDKYNNIQPSKFIDEPVEKKFHEFLEFITPKKEDANYLELLASIHWLKTRNADKDRDVILQHLMNMKPNLIVNKYEHAWNDLKKYNLIN